MDGFRKFILRGNVVDLAVGVVIGAAFGAIVAALVKDIVTPIIAAIVGKPDFSTLHFTVHKSTFLYGDFINAVVSFLLIATAVYFFVVLPVNTLMSKFGTERDPESPKKECSECLSSIPQGATRCAFCSVEQAA